MATWSETNRCIEPESKLAAGMYVRGAHAARLVFLLARPCWVAMRASPCLGQGVSCTTVGCRKPRDFLSCFSFDGCSPQHSLYVRFLTSPKVKVKVNGLTTIACVYISLPPPPVSRTSGQ